MMRDTHSFRKTIRFGMAAVALAGAFGSASLLAATEEQHDHSAHAGHEAAATPAADVAAGRQLFSDWSCGTCHALKDAGGSGHVGPAFDGNSMSVDYAVSRISNGQGAMPAFAGLMTDEEISTLANYIVATSEKK